MPYNRQIIDTKSQKSQKKKQNTNWSKKKKKLLQTPFSDRFPLQNTQNTRFPIKNTHKNAHFRPKNPFSSVQTPKIAPQNP
jgi:hypothetical protein